MDQSNPKIVTLTKITNIVRELKNSGKKVIQCHGVFDLVHPGHIRYFKSARKYGDTLVVTLIGDKYVRKGPGRPIFNENLRAEVLASLFLIDYVVIVQTESAVEVIKKLKPNVFVKGPNHKFDKSKLHVSQKTDQIETVINSIGGKLIYTDDDTIFSSTHLINKHLEIYPDKTKKYLNTLSKLYNDESIINLLQGIKNKKILVIGDAIIDQYHYTLPLGKSSKEPLVVHTYKSEESFAGGILATANHLAALSDNIQLVTLLGKKLSYVGFIKHHLKPQVKPIFIYQNDAPTIIKRRFIDQVTQQKLFQVSYLKDEVVSPQSEAKIVKFLRKDLPSYDLVMVNDYGHGLMSPKIIRLVCRKAKYLALNVQANSANYGFNIVTKYPRADFVCMDEHEIRLATHDKHSDLLRLMKKIFRKLNCQELVVTRGSDGAVSIKTGNILVEAPALSHAVVDRVGAGDAFFAIASPCAYIGMNQMLVSFMGNVAGALKVQSIGNKTPIEYKDLIKFISSLLK